MDHCLLVIETTDGTFNCVLIFGLFVSLKTRVVGNKRGENTRVENTKLNQKRILVQGTLLQLEG